ncbi:hypothetical protein VaNZ11_014032 [Volvox africanus]|uniref:Uncharacterized protein n=1 Tax=Volvox africanus TaxID=51714 RepID=A0ABQ5SHK2_9CHLO|nr:hypothetical protein VaNZ11_014032 [Volvox africanus]
MRPSSSGTMLYEPSSPKAGRHNGFPFNPPPLTPYRGLPAPHTGGSAGTLAGTAAIGAISPQAGAAMAMSAAAVGGSAVISGVGRQHHPPAPPLWDQVLELEKRLRAEMRKKSFWDPDVRRLRATLQGTYEALMFGHYDFAYANEAEPNLWKAVFYKPIEEFRSRIRALETLVRGTAGSATSGVSMSSGAGGGTSTPGAAMLCSPEEARAQLGRTTAAYMRFLDEALAFYRKMVWKLQWVHGNVGAVVDLDAALQMEIQDCVPRATCPRTPEARQSVDRCLIYLGDLCRYQSMALKDRAASARPLWERARSYYRQAARVLPASGNPYNQMAVMSYYTNDELRAVYYYFRSLAVSMPFATARENLLMLFEKNRNRYDNIASSHATAALQGGHEADVRTAAGHVADVAVRFVRLHGMLFDKINLHQFPEVLAAAMRDLETMLDNPGCRAILQKAPDADQLLFHLAIMNIFSVHSVSAGGGAAGGEGVAGTSYAAAAKRAELMCNSLTVAMRFAAIVTSVAASMAGIAAAGGGVGDVETGFGAASAACHVMLAWIVSNPEVLSPKPAGTITGSGSGSGVGSTEVPPEVAAEVTARCAFLTAAARLAMHLSDLTRRRAHDQDWQDPAVRHRSLPEDSELAGFGPLAPVVSVAAAWPATSESPGGVAVFAVRVARMLQALRHLDDALGPGLLLAATAAGPSASISPRVPHSSTTSPWHAPAASVAVPPPGSALAQELTRAVRGFRNAVVRATVIHAGQQASLLGGGSGNAAAAAGGNLVNPPASTEGQMNVHNGLAPGNSSAAATASGLKGGASGNGGQQQQQQQRLLNGGIEQEKQQQQSKRISHSGMDVADAMLDNIRGSEIEDRIMTDAVFPTALLVPAQQQHPSGLAQPLPPSPQMLNGGDASDTVPPHQVNVGGSGPTCANYPQRTDHGELLPRANATVGDSSACSVGGASGIGRTGTDDDGVEDEIVYQPPRLPRPTSTGNGLQYLHQQSASGGGGMGQLQDGKSALPKQPSGSSAAPISQLVSREASRDGLTMQPRSPSILELNMSPSAVAAGAPLAMPSSHQGIALNIGNTGGMEDAGGSGRTCPGSAHGSTLPLSPKHQFVHQQQSQLQPSQALPFLKLQANQLQQQNPGRGHISPSIGNGAGGSATGMAPAAKPSAPMGPNEKLAQPQVPFADELLVAMQQTLLRDGDVDVDGSLGATRLPSAPFTASGGQTVGTPAPADGTGERPGSDANMSVRRPPAAGTTSAPSGANALPASTPAVTTAALALHPHSPQVLQLDKLPQTQQLLQGPDASVPITGVATVSAAFAGLPASLQQRAQKNQHEEQPQLDNQTGVSGLLLLTGGSQVQRPSAAGAAASLGLGQGPGPGQGHTAPLVLPLGTFQQAQGTVLYNGVTSSCTAAAFPGLPVPLTVPRLTGGTTVSSGATCPTTCSQLGWPTSSVVAANGIGNGLDMSSYFTVAAGNYQAAAIAEATAEATAVAMADELLQAMDEDDNGANGRSAGGTTGFGMFGGGGSSRLYGGEEFLDIDRFSPAMAAAAAMGASGGAAPVTREHSTNSDAIFITAASGGSASAGAGTATGMFACHSSGSGSGGGFLAGVLASTVSAPIGGYRASADGAGTAFLDLGLGLGPGNTDAFGARGLVPTVVSERAGNYYQVLRRSGGGQNVSAGGAAPTPQPGSQAQGPQRQVQETGPAAASAGHGGVGNGGVFGEDLSCLSYLAAQLQRPHVQMQGQGKGLTWQGQAQGCHLPGPAGAQG